MSKRRYWFRLDVAVQRAVSYGYTDLSIRTDPGNPIVRTLQDWWPDGTEVARFVRAYGKYRGESVGFAIRPK